MLGRDNTATGFGWVRYKGNMHQEDILILANGEVVRRDSDEVLRKYGTMKAISVNEMEMLLSGNPEVIVIGTGQGDSLRMPPEALDLLNKSNSRLVQGMSPKAVRYFDSLSCPKAALIHVK